MSSPILDSTAPVAPYVPGSNPYLLRTESTAAGRSILAVTGTPAADRVPYFSSSSVVGLATLTAAGRTLIGLANSAALVTLAGTSPSIVGTNLLQLAAPVSTPSYMKVRHNLDNEVSYLTPAQVLSDIGAQPLDSDLTSLAGASATDAIYYRNSPGNWQTVTPGTALRFASGQLNAAPWLIITGTYAASSGEKIQAYTGHGGFTITLPPSPSPGDWVLIEDAFGTELQWGDGTPLTVGRNGSKINSSPEDWVADESDVNRGPKLSCVYIDSLIGWCVK